MSFINKIKETAKRKLMTIVLPESMDERTYAGAVLAVKEKIAKIIILGDEAKVEKYGSKYDLTGIEIIDPAKSDRLEDYTRKLAEIRANKGMTEDMARATMLADYMYFACMMVKMGDADGVVSGACHSTANTLRPALQILKTKPGVKLVSSFFIIEVPDCEYGENGTFIFADCGLEQNPDSGKLAAIGASTAESFVTFIGEEPRVAFLSHSTMGSAKHPDVDKVVEAVRIAKEQYPQYLMDGELQFDAAIIPSVAALKAPNSRVAGKANVLIFPTLDAGNIGYKLVQRLAKADAYGPICQGISKPVNDLSRGCSAEDIAGVVAITAVQARLSQV